MLMFVYFKYENQQKKGETPLNRADVDKFACFLTVQFCSWLGLAFSFVN